MSELKKCPFTGNTCDKICALNWGGDCSIKVIAEETDRIKQYFSKILELETKLKE